MQVPEKLFNSMLTAQLEKFGQVRLFEAGSIIQNEDSFIRSIPIVLNGSIKVLRIDENGQEILLYYIKRGESCIMSFLGGIANDTSKVRAVAEENTEILMIPVDKATQWVKEFPEWTDYIFKLYHKRFEELLSVVNSIAFQKLDARLIYLLRQKARLHQTNEINITHQQLANELGTSREVISRVLKQLEKSRVISLSRNKILLL